MRMEYAIAYSIRIFHLVYSIRIFHSHIPSGENRDTGRKKIGKIHRYRAQKILTHYNTHKYTDTGRKKYFAYIIRIFHLTKSEKQGKKHNISHTSFAYIIRIFHHTKSEKQGKKHNISHTSFAYSTSQNQRNRVKNISHTSFAYSISHSFQFFLPTISTDSSHTSSELCENVPYSSQVALVLTLVS
jgi:hypothetical protein